MLTLYGIPNCDTVKKARKWLDNQEIEYTFSNFRETRPDTSVIQQWASAAGWEKLLNKRSTSFRNLSDADKTDLDENRAIQLMTNEPTLIKRPVLELDGQIEIGFSEKRYQELLG